MDIGFLPVVAGMEEAQKFEQDAVQMGVGVAFGEGLLYEGAGRGEGGEAAGVLHEKGSICGLEFAFQGAELFGKAGIPSSVHYISGLDDAAVGFGKGTFDDCMLRHGLRRWFRRICGRKE